jgi:RHS repeat-associated protein
MYDNANRRTQLRLPNLVTIDYAYDAANRLTSLSYSGLAGGTPTQNLTYAYDPAGNRTVMGGSWARTLLPNAISSASYDAANRQLTLGGKTMYYDFNGNLTQISEGGQNTDLTWDVRDRLTNMTGPGLTASFAYDAKARRTQKTITGFTSTFQYDGADIVREVAGGSGVNYLRGLGMDEHLARIEDGGNTTCYAPDALGSTLALTNSSGSVATEYTYEPFGRTTATGASSQNAFQFTGRENDGTGLYYYRARYYNPSIHRFASEDPLLAPVSFLRCPGPQGAVQVTAKGRSSSAYAYVANNPVGFVDPTGLEKQIPPTLIMIAASAGRSESCYECATRIAAEMGGKYPHPRAHNLIRHCITACEISKQCHAGIHCARVMGGANELRALLPRRFGGRGEFETEDLRNNEAGIRCSRHPSCAQCCQTVESRGTPP